jgi:hypothetical protein
MDDIENEIKKLKLETEFPKTFKKLVEFNSTKKSIYPKLDEWFYSLGFDMVVTPVINPKTEDINGYVAGIKNYKKVKYFNSDLDYISIIEEPLKNMAKCYSELTNFIFSKLEEYYTWNID